MNRPDWPAIEGPTEQDNHVQRPAIYLVPTPLGNLGDITLRALETLRAADLVAAEDTRTSGRLLQHYGISRPFVSLHLHNEHHRIPGLLARVQAESLCLAVVSDAGTPGLSDPGFLLVREAIAAGLPVYCLPGPTAAIPALMLSGMPTHRFVFEGFLPPKKGRQTRMKELATEARTIVLYESPHRIAKTLSDLAVHLGQERQAALVREISKKFEEVRRGSLAKLAAQAVAQPPKGEIVLVLAGAAPQGREED